MKKDNSAPDFAKPMLPAVLKLTVKKEWFDLIKSGEKTEEYREIKEYWIKRLAPVFSWDMGKYPIKLNENKNVINRVSLKPNEFEYIEFKNGYSKDAPTIIAKFNGVKIGNPTQGGKHLFKDGVFIISIGDIVWSNCG